MMPEVADVTETYFADFARLERDLLVRNDAWLEPIRKAAMERFGEVGFPTTRQEDWRFTNVSPLARTPFKAAAAERHGLSAAKVKQAFLKGVAARIVFVNGFFDPKLSDLAALPPGVSVRALAESWEAPPKSLEEHLARHAETDRNAFVALNTALFRDGAFIEIADGIVVGKPIQALFIRAGSAGGTVTHPRMLIIAGREAQAMVIETHVSLGEE